MRKIKCVVKRPDELYGHMAYVSNSIENLQKTVGGYIEAVTLADGPRSIVAICNEEGKIKGFEKNLKLPWNDVLVGTIIICGIDGEEFSDIPISFGLWKGIVDVFEGRKTNESNE